MTAQIQGRATPDIVARAAEWAAELDADSVPMSVRDACEAWCRENPLNRRTLERMRGLADRFDTLDPAARTALRRSTVSSRNPLPRRVALGAVIALGLGAVGWGVSQSPFVQERSPDYQTALGAQRTIALADGSALMLDTASAVNLSLKSDRRTATLIRGQLFVKVAPNRAAPFTVRTRDGEATALGTAYTVSREVDATVVTVVESRVRVCAPRLLADDCLDLEAGERAKLSKGSVTRLAAIDPREASGWTSGWLEVDDRPVVDILEALNRYRATPVAYDRKALKTLRVTGSYPLADPDRALEAIAATAGLTVTRRGEQVTVQPAS